MTSCLKLRLKLVRGMSLQWCRLWHYRQRVGLTLNRVTCWLSMLSCLLCRSLLTTLLTLGVSMLTVVMAWLLLPRCTQKVPTVLGQPTIMIGFPMHLLARQCLRLARRLVFYLVGNLKLWLECPSILTVLEQLTCMNGALISCLRCEIMAGLPCLVKK